MSIVKLLTNLTTSILAFDSWLLVLKIYDFPYPTKAIRSPISL